MNQRGEGGHLDKVCTVVDSGVVIMIPALAFTLTALTITVREDQLRVSRPQPFLEAAARALDIDRLTVIDTGVDSPSGQAGQWDDGGNALAIGPRVAVCNERNVQTNARLAGAGFDVITVPANELGGFRGGPRALCAPIQRDPVPMPEPTRASGEPAQPARAPQLDPAVVSEPRIPGPAGPANDQPHRVGELTPIR
jgi:arginine deiminase